MKWIFYRYLQCNITYQKPNEAKCRVCPNNIQTHPDVFQAIAIEKQAKFGRLSSCQFLLFFTRGFYQPV